MVSSEFVPEYPLVVSELVSSGKKVKGGENEEVGLLPFAINYGYKLLVSISILLCLFRRDV